MSAENLQKFLENLDQDPAVQQAYRDDPAETLATYGVAPEHQKMIQAGDVGGVQKALQTLGGSAASTAITMLNSDDT